MAKNGTAWHQLKNSVLSVDAVRKVDRLAVDVFGMHSLVLMENAAVSSVDWLARRFPGSQRAVILCGRGNNGGDGLAISRHLDVLGWDCHVFAQGPRETLSHDALANLDILLAGKSAQCVVRTDGHSETTQSTISNADVVVDAMLGTGASGAPRSPFAEWIAAANHSRAFRVAIDIPTGVDARTGAVSGDAFRPDATLTFVARKPAMELPTAGKRFGEIAVLPIGIPVALIRQMLTEHGS